ncbi:MAG: hypothetical protein JNJ53_08630 [Rhizobiales bacterium]|nr:hypothetical protein [Hyphomicrobiales bacterium]
MSLALVLGTRRMRQGAIYFPAGWDEHLGEVALSENGCPMSANGLRDYLMNCHYQYVLDEETLELGELKQTKNWIFPDRRFWFWTCQDRVGREWLVLVGSGKSPFAGEEKDRQRWVIGQSNPGGMTPDEFLLSHFPEHAGMSGKAN